jgi:hypothetical protein
MRRREVKLALRAGVVASLLLAITFGVRVLPVDPAHANVSRTFASSRGSSKTTVSAPTSVQPTGIGGNWSLVFDDEFSGSSLSSQWTNDNGWTNQNNVTDSSKNVSVAGGDLTLTLASKSSGAQVATTSFNLAVGEYVEARIEFPGTGKTVYDWPAWWLSGPGWPNAGENDIAEGLGTLTVNYHGPGVTDNTGTVAGTWAGGFHTYGLYRGATSCQVYYDGKLVRSYPTDDDGLPETLILTMGAANTLKYGSQGQMAVDYVRAWSPA